MINQRKLRPESILIKPKPTTAPSGALEGNIVSTLSSLNIHDIVDTDIKTEVLNTEDRSFTVSKYRFIDSEGNVFTVNAFLRERQDK